ncbi:hypothetical protein FB45DRAFT_739896 [Roridomyces roridus]|uniref:BTB domain-containing protein n=1 Tax=Roridomyces roridus TaxID=1738132 RepID=A0AAD7C553_9AGAR|nr:hypothetical protein FB45DRAFT_739896 [Roridomyces roridus]
MDSSEYEQLVSRAEQLVLLTSTLSSASKVRDDALSLQISRLSGQLGQIQTHLGLNPVPAAPAPISILDGVRHSSLYLRDGNLVIAAPVLEGAGGTLLFRVHQSMLSMQSPVFASMFTLPPPGTNLDVYDGVPYVHLPDDSRDIESVLKVLYDPFELPHKRLDPKTPIRVRRALAMATKYEMDNLRNRIVTQVEADWPSSLAEWDRLEMEARALQEEHDANDEQKVDGLYLDDRLPEPITAIRLSRDFQIPKILPAAVYHLSRLHVGDDWLQLRQEPNQLQLTRTARWDLAEAEDLKMLLRVRETISDFPLVRPKASNSCTSPSECRRWRDTRHFIWITEKDILQVMRKFIEARPSRSLCKYCWNDAKSVIETDREELWADIVAAIAEFDK